MKKLLFIDYVFPPLAADFRGAALARFLPEFGWQPIIISAADTVSYDKDLSLLREIPKEVEVHRIGHRELPMEWETVLNRLKVNCSFPDRYGGWRSPALREAGRILTREPIDLIYSASPPFTTSFVAMQLHRELRIPWVADFLDGWAVNDFLTQHYDRTLVWPLRSLQRSRVRKAEADILRSAERTVVISWHVKQRLLELHNAECDSIDVITDGYDEHVFRDLRPHALYPGKLTIVFLGSYYSAFREPLMAFCDAVNELDSEAEVVFIGRGAAQVQALGKGATRQTATYIGNLPREKALSFALGSDFLFVVMPSYAKWIPTKIYDYLRLGKPILALVPADGDAAKIIREAKGGFILSHEAEDMKRQLKSIFSEWKQGRLKDFHPDASYVAQFDRRRLSEKLALVFDKVLEQRHRR